MFKHLQESLGVQKHKLFTIIFTKTKDNQNNLRNFVARTNEPLKHESSYTTCQSCFRHY